MTTPSDDPIRILLVNDDASDLEHYRALLKKKCSERLTAYTFGPEEAGTQQVARTLLHAFASPTRHRALKFRIDVLFVDYRMVDINGLAFVGLLRTLTNTAAASWASRIPVVLMTKYESSLLENLESDPDSGVAGHIFTDRDLFWLDAEATARRVFQDSQRERWAEAIMNISSRLPTVAGRPALCDLIATALDKTCPEIRLFIRDYDSVSDTLTLVGASRSVPDDARRRLSSVAPKRFPMLSEAVSGEIAICNSFDEIAPPSLPKDDRDLCRRLQLHRGMSFPLRDAKGTTFGTISMYRRAIDPPFSPLEAHYADLVSRQVAAVWTARRERQQGLAYTHFLTEFTRCEDENVLFTELVNHLHDTINGRATTGSLTKTTFKALAAGSSRLVCRSEVGHHRGVSRDVSFMPSVFSETSVSAWVTRNNRPRLVEDFHDEKDYSSTNPSMVSELCLPVAGAREGGEPVLGVVNLECSERGFYTEEDLQYAGALCRLSGYHAYRLRAQSFMSRLLQSLGDKGDREELVSRSIQLIKELTGYRLLLLIVRESSRWRINRVDVSKGAVTAETTSYIEGLLNSQEPRTLFRMALAKGSDTFYEPALASLPEGSYGVLSEVLDADEAVRSQAVFMLRAGEVIVGALSLDFVVTNALSHRHLELLSHFAAWLGKLILQDDSVKTLSERVKLLDQLQPVADVLSRVWHSSEGELYLLRNLVEACLASEGVTNQPELRSHLRDLQVGIKHISRLPERLGARKQPPHFESIEAQLLSDEVLELLRSKAAQLEVSVSSDVGAARVWADRDTLKMVLYHLLDNALDACSGQQVRTIALRTRPAADNMTEIAVSDSGMGAAADDLARMVTLGYTTKPNGIGYGLFWVKQHVAEMEGTFVLHSDGPGAGLTATVKMPKTRNGLTDGAVRA